METKEYRVGEICEIIDGDRGKNYPSEKEFSENGYCLFLNAGNVTKNGWNFSDVHFISKEKDEILKKGKVAVNDIIMTSRGTVGNFSLYDASIPYKNMRINSGMVILRPVENIDRYFLLYYFKSGLVQTLIRLYCSGSAQPQLPIKDFSKIKLKIPPLQTQQKIANILSRYDEAIENNNKRIKLLEQLAQNIYKEWFVRFRFPGCQDAKFKDSGIGKIPNTFNVLKQNEVISDYIGGGWGEDEKSSNFPIQAAVVRGADFPEFTKGDISTCHVRFHKKSNYESRIINEDDIVLEVSGGTQEQPVGRTVIVTKERLARFDNRLICASFCKLIRLNKEVIAPFFYYYWMQFIYETRTIDRYQLQSTGIINFKFEYFLRKGDVLLPPSELMWKFDSKIRKIHEQIENLSKANENLIKQRDLLLPRLMSGNLEIK